MMTYIALTIAIAILSFFESIFRSKNRIFFIIALIITVMFVGLRFETGADWAEYETLLYMTSPLFSSIPMYFNPNLIVEPGFSTLMSLVNSLNLPFQALLFICAAFSLGVLGIFLYKYSRYPTIVLLWYCGFALLLGQMAAIRQVVAYGFLLLAFLVYDRGRLALSIVWSLAAISMHVFAAVLVPIVYLRLRPPRTPAILLICVIGLATTMFGINLFALLVAPISLIFGGLIGTKLEIYGGFGAFKISFFAYVLMLWHGAMIILINRPSLDEWKHPVVRFAIYAAIWSLVAHTYLAALPAVWNRVMLMSMPLELLALLRCYDQMMLRPLRRVLAISGVWLASAASIGYGLSQENALPYLPYQSVPGYWLTGDPGNGRVRYMIEQERLNRQALEDRLP